MLFYLISGLAIVFSLFSAAVTYYFYKSTRTDPSYSDIDNQYNELLKLGLDEPDLRNYDKTSRFYKLDSEDNFKKKYHIYAYMCWRLVETVFDRQKDKKGRLHLSETWIPVMYEENRLHYAWFKHNIRLFKPDFQKFVTSQLNDIEFREGDISDLKNIYRTFQEDFAADELKDYDHLEMLLIKKKYKLLLAKHKVFNEIIGYAFIYEIDHVKALWLDYMAINSKFQNAGYGTLLFNLLAESKQDGITGIFIEVEIPEEQEGQSRDEQKRRINFYERLGAKKLNIQYELPTKDYGLPMHLYFRPSPNVQVLPKQQIKEAIASAFENIHSDIQHRDQILKRFVTSIGDEHFK